MKPTLHDWFSLIYMKIAKAKRNKFIVSQETIYYESYFMPSHIQRYKTDILATLRREEILKFLSKEDPGLVTVDLGCGTGDVVNMLNSNHFCIGVDLSLNSLKLAQQQSGNTKFICSSLYHLPFENESFDVVTCLETLEHMADDLSVVVEISRILKSGGHLIASVPSEYYFADYLPLTGHYRHYSRSQLEDLLNHAGLRVVTYLNNYPRFAAMYRYMYAILALINLLLMRIKRDNLSIYQRKLLFSNMPAYEWLRRYVFNRLASRDASLPLDRLQSSTFCVAEKMASSQTRINLPRL